MTASADHPSTPGPGPRSGFGVRRVVGSGLVAGTVTAVGILGVLTACGVAGGALQDVVGRQDDFCDRLEQAYPAFRADPRPMLGPDAGASEWKAWFDLARQRNAQLIASAPTDVVGALTGIQTTNDKLAAFYADAEYNPAQIDAGALAQLLADGGYEQSLATVTSYARTTCHIDTGS